jgi:hypothetical protein
VKALIQCEGYVTKAMEKKSWQETKSYLRKILEQCPDSIKHTCLMLETLVCANLRDLTEAVQYTTKVQSQFIEHPDFLFWRGRIFLYNGQTDMGKKHIRQAL